jgi:dihydrofolate reductase
MRKIIVGAQVSIDGVMQAPGGKWEDPTGGFKFGGWAMPHFDDVAGAEIDHLFQNCDLLLGRKTYEIFAGYWPHYDEKAPAGNIARTFNRIRKYVVSRSGDVDTSWRGSVLLRSVDEVERLRKEDGPNLVTQGSTELIHALFAKDLVDQLSVWSVPVILGRGKKLFVDGAVPHGYRLSRSRVGKTGVIVAHYERAGDVKLDHGSEEILGDAEKARRERVKREG